MTTETLKVEQEFTTLDLLLWRRFRREVPGLVEATLAANPGLADAGPYLTPGTLVRVDAPAAEQARAPTLIRLYD